MAGADPMVDIRDLAVTFTGGRRRVRAVNGVSLAVRPGEVVALLGESGSGKSVTLRSLLRLHPPRTLIEGEIQVAGADVMSLSWKALGDLRGRIVSMVFQEPRLALDPGLHAGAPDRRGDPAPRGGGPCRGPRPGPRPLRAGAHPLARAAARHLPP